MLRLFFVLLPCMFFVSCNTTDKQHSKTHNYYESTRNIAQAVEDPKSFSSRLSSVDDKYEEGGTKRRQYLNRIVDGAEKSMSLNSFLDNRYFPGTAQASDNYISEQRQNYILKVASYLSGYSTENMLLFSSFDDPKTEISPSYYIAEKFYSILNKSISISFMEKYHGIDYENLSPRSSSFFSRIFGGDKKYFLPSYLRPTETQHPKSNRWSYIRFWEAMSHYHFAKNVTEWCDYVESMISEGSLPISSLKERLNQYGCYLPSIQEQERFATSQACRAIEVNISGGQLDLLKASDPTMELGSDDCSIFLSELERVNYGVRAILLNVKRY